MKTSPIVVCLSVLLWIACSDASNVADSAIADGHANDVDAVADVWIADTSGADDTHINPDAGDVDSYTANDAAVGLDQSTPADVTSTSDVSIVPTTGCAQISAEILAATGNTLLVSPGAFGEVLYNGNATTLRQVVQQAHSGDTILLADGTYTFYAANTGHGDYTGLYFSTANVTMRSQSGNAAAVILDSNYVEHGNQSATITLDASGVTLADITVKRSVYHLIHFWSGADNIRVHNVHLIDGGQQFIKASGTDIDNDEISCSRFVMTDTGRANVWGYGTQDSNTRCYTGGIDTHNARSWHVHDNFFEGIHCDAAVEHPMHGLASDTYFGGLAEHAIHMWDAVAGHGHVIERNQIVNCARGIGLGMATDVYDSVVQNNSVFSSYPGGSEHDVGINVERGHNIRIDNNSVFFSSPNAYSNAIEYRYESTDLALRNNLTNKTIRDRNGATATLSNNVTNAQGSWFVDAAAAGDLHLATCSVTAVVGQGVVLVDVNDDIDGQARGSSNDIGADQCTP